MVYSACDQVESIFGIISGNRRKQANYKALNFAGFQELWRVAEKMMPTG